MPTSAIDLSNALISHLANIETTRKKSELLFSKRVIVHRDIDIIYTGLYLEAITSFERFIEELFLSLLSERVSHPSRRVVPKIIFKSFDSARKLLKGERTYLDWFPYDLTIKRAKVYFQYGLPFIGLDKNIDITIHPSIDKRIKKSIEKFVAIRNALAHKSKHSYNIFEKTVISGTTLSNREKKPIGYLRGLHTTAPPTTRYEIIIGEINYLVRLITSRNLH